LPDFDSYDGLVGWPTGWSSMIVQTQTWQKVTKFYRDITEKNTFFRPMLELAEQIAASKYASGLYPWTSMHTLCISQTPEADSDKEVLRISLDPQDGVLVYDFQETGSTLPKYQHWTRRCSPDEGFSRFERFIQLKKWFVDYRPQS
jgi:hypothetical protein